jgi:hypothetical protein
MVQKKKKKKKKERYKTGWRLCWAIAHHREHTVRHSNMHKDRSPCTELDKGAPMSRRRARARFTLSAMLELFFKLEFVLKNSNQGCQSGSVRSPVQFSSTVLLIEPAAVQPKCPMGETKSARKRMTNSREEPGCLAPPGGNPGKLASKRFSAKRSFDEEKHPT